MVSSTPGFTAKWLVPRLYRFLARYPDMEVRISASAGYANFTSDGVDVGIRLSSGVHPELYVEKLSEEWLLLLCSPRLLDGEQPIPIHEQAYTGHYTLAGSSAFEAAYRDALGAALDRMIEQIAQDPALIAALRERTAPEPVVPEIGERRDRRPRGGRGPHG